MWAWHDFRRRGGENEREEGMRNLLLATCAVLALSAGGAIGESALAQNTVNNTGTSTINGGSSLGSGQNLSGTSTLTGIGKGGSGANAAGSSTVSGTGSGGGVGVGGSSTAAAGSGNNAEGSSTSQGTKGGGANATT